MNILRGAALISGNASTKPSSLDLYLESSAKTQTLRLFIEIDKKHYLESFKHSFDPFIGIIGYP
jgi:hypothetical protein